MATTRGRHPLSRTSTRRWRAWSSVVLLLALVLSGCQSDGGAAASGTEASTADGTDSATAAAPSGVVRYAPSVSLVTMDPHNFIGGGLTWLTPVYEPLFRRVLGSEGEVEPLLATDYEVDGTTVTIDIREDVTFTEGEPFNAAAVKANLERGKEVGVRPELAPIDTVTVVDEYTVEVELSRPSPGFIPAMASVSGFMISPAALDADDLDRAPVGTGPWVYSPGESTEGEVHVYTPNEDYWNPEAQGVERIEVYDMPDEQARVNALQTEQIDLAAISAASAAEIETDSSLGVLQLGYGTTFGVPILDRQGSVVDALGDQRVRQAMSLAIDREAFVEAVNFGRGVPNIQPAPPGHWAHDDSLDDQITYDPERAAELLEEAGYGDGFSFTIPSIPPFSSAIQVMGEFWRDVGIQAEVEPIEPGTLAGRSRTTDFPVTMLNWVTGTDMSLYVPTYLAEDATFNPFGAEPEPRILELAEQGISSTDISEQAPAYHEMAQIIAEQLPVIYIASPETLLGSTASLAGNDTVEFAAGQTTLIWHELRLPE